MKVVALIALLGASNVAFAQSESWKIVVDAIGGWGQNFALEVLSSGTLVISERRSTQMPRCMQVPDDDIAYLTERVARLTEYVDNASKPLPRMSWSRRIEDGLEAEFSVYVGPGSHVLTAHASLGPAHLYESDGWWRTDAGGSRQERPPQFLADILAKVWEWQRQREGFAVCVPASERPQGV